ncbi:hypothetical protein Efla_007418 [Eimeria flavescens]
MRRRKSARFSSAALRKLSGRLTSRIQIAAHFYAAFNGTCELLRYRKNRVSTAALASSWCRLSDASIYTTQSREHAKGKLALAKEDENGLFQEVIKARSCLKSDILRAQRKGLCICGPEDAKVYSSSHSVKAATPTLIAKGKENRCWNRRSSGGVVRKVAPARADGRRLGLAVRLSEKLSGRLTTRIQIAADFYAALSGTCELLVSAE